MTYSARLRGEARVDETPFSVPHLEITADLSRVQIAECVYTRRRRVFATALYEISDTGIRRRLSCSETVT
jgi:hypothetical protein